MNDDFSASGSQKTGSGSTPFDQIKDHEQREAERVERELAVFERERQDVMKSAREDEESSETAAREKAREELRSFREKSVQEVFARGEARAEKAAATLRDGYGARAPEAVQLLVNEAFSPSSTLLSA